jgi:hypothetical protein
VITPTTKTGNTPNGTINAEFTYVETKGSWGWRRDVNSKGGNAATASKLATPVRINGVEFDGSKDITMQGMALAMNADFWSPFAYVYDGRIYYSSYGNSGINSFTEEIKAKAFHGTLIGNIDSQSFVRYDGINDRVIASKNFDKCLLDHLNTGTYVFRDGSGGDTSKYFYQVTCCGNNASNAIYGKINGNGIELYDGSGNLVDGEFHLMIQRGN